MVRGPLCMCVCVCVHKAWLVSKHPKNIAPCLYALVGWLWNHRTGSVMERCFDQPFHSWSNLVQSTPLTTDAPRRMGSTREPHFQEMEFRCSLCSNLFTSRNILISCNFDFPNGNLRSSRPRYRGMPSATKGTSFGIKPSFCFEASNESWLKLHEKNTTFKLYSGIL